MPFAANEERLPRLAEQLRSARALTPDLMSAVVAGACARLPLLNKVWALRIEALAKAGAWTDAALLILELELPAWRLRRLVCDGEWLCSLSRQPNLPLDLDDTADGRHAVLPLAILSAFLEARGRTVAGEARVLAMPQAGARLGYAVCCDNYS